MAPGLVEVAVVGLAVLTFVLICMLLGAIAGLMAGLLGIGGGLIIVPALVFILPIFQQLPSEQVIVVAVATSLCSIIFTCSSSAWAHHKLRHISWGYTPILLVGAAIGAVITGYFAHFINANILKKIFGFAVLFLGLRMFINQVSSSRRPLPQKSILGLMSIVLAMLASLLGIGGGALYVPMLTHFSVGVRHAIGAASIIGFVIACFATSGYVVAGWQQFHDEIGYIGYVYWPAVLAIVATSLIAAQFGAKLTSRLPVDKIKKIFGVFLLIVSARMLLS